MNKNEAQERVINEIDGQLIVIACPGSGKTTTILRRINHMVNDVGINPEEILMITFTNEAAKEMKARYAKQYGDNSGVTFCTIHALCVAFLKKFDGFLLENLLTNNRDMITNIIKNDDRHRGISDLDSFIRDVLTDITVVQSSNINIDDYKPQSCQDYDFFSDIYKSYQTEKKDRGVFDYDDILLRTYHLMKSDREYRDFMRDKYAYIHVDEYQDTNKVQKDIVYMIAGDNGNITVVGDDDQSIYGFRGANPAVMQDFIRHYPDAKEIYMSINYRSDKKIIEDASKLVNYNQLRFKKDIKTFSQDDGTVSLHKATSKKEEALKIAGEITKMINSGTDPNDIAVLYRINSQSALIIDSLVQMKIPFYSNEALPNRYQDDMYRDIVAYHKMAIAKGNEFAGGRDAFIRTITRPNRFFSNYNKMSYTDTAEQMKKTAYNPNVESWKNDKAMENIDKYHKLLKALSVLSNLELFINFVYNNGYREYLQHYAQYRKIPFDELEYRWNQYIEDIRKNHITSFEEWDRYAQNFTRMMQEIQNQRSGVCISTMHKAKGLEWDTVIMMDCMEQMTPFRKAQKVSEIEEERRLFYVGMTRAKHNLIFYYHLSSKWGDKSKPSRFLSECGVL